MLYPKVSILIPCLNEARYIESVLRDIESQTYSLRHLEVWVIDGGSTDGTRELVANFRTELIKITLLDNPDRFVPQAMNRGIRESQGAIIVRMDAHASYPPDYVEKLVAGLLKTGADNVGGVWITRPRNNSPKARAIAAVLTHPLGVGNALFRIGVDRPVEADTVPFGCYPRGVFDKYGYYDERLERNQDIELNKRIRAGGGKIFLLPEVHCTYFARDTFRDLWKNNFQNGRWVIRTAFLTGQLASLSLRHFVPLGFVLYLLGAILLSLAGWWWVWVPFLIYFILTGIAGLGIAIRARCFPMLPLSRIAFGALHLSYGLGSLWGIMELPMKKKVV
ncbi:MAG: glycosyltransferase [Saprospirales bacterium]|nr:glycosyltransferase [Saprospirales bacterium]